MDVRDRQRVLRPANYRVFLATGIIICGMMIVALTVFVTLFHMGFLTGKCQYPPYQEQAICQELSRDPNGTLYLHKHIYIHV